MTSPAIYPRILSDIAGVSREILISYSFSLTDLKASPVSLLTVALFFK